MDISLLDQFSIGLELEANIIHANTGKPVIDFNNSKHFSQLEKYLREKNCNAPQTEFDAATIELITSPHTKIDDAFHELTRTLFYSNEYLQKHGYLSLLLGLHPGRARDDLQVTKKQRCIDSQPLMAENGGPLFYCSFQINLGIPIALEKHLLPLCHALQAYMWPCSVITQSSSVFANHYSQYQCFRTYLNSAVSLSRTGPLPAEISSWDAFQDYCAHLPDEHLNTRKNNVWFDIFPKYIDENDPTKGYRIEIRLADTVDLKRSYYFTQAIVLTFFSLLEKLIQQDTIIQPPLHWASVNRDHILKNGRTATLTLDGKSFMSLYDYFTRHWQPLISNWANQLGIESQQLITHLLAKTRAEEMMLAIEKKSGDQIALNYAKSDAIVLASLI